MTSPQTKTHRPHSHHDRTSSAVFTDYARKESSKMHSAHARMVGSTGNVGTKRSKKKIVSTSKNPNKDVLTRLEDTAFTWCHNQLMPVIENSIAVENPKPKSSTRSKWKTKRLPERPRSPIIITSNPYLNLERSAKTKDKVIQVPVLEEADDSTPSTISASSSTASLDYIDDSDTYAFSVATNSIAEGTLDTARLNRKIHKHCIGVSNVKQAKQTFTTKNSPKEPFVAPHEHLAVFCNDHCNKFCATTEGMLNGMLHDPEEKEGKDKEQEEGISKDPVKKERESSSGTDSTTSEETTSSSSSSEDSTSSENVEQVYSQNLSEAPAKKNRFSSLWKKSIKDRRHSAKAAQVPEVEVDYPSYYHRDKQHDIEVKLKSWDNAATSNDVAPTRNNRSTPTFRPIASLRNLRQQKLEQEQLLQKQIDRSLRNLRRQKAGGEPYDEQHQLLLQNGRDFLFEHKISVVQKDGGSDGMKNIGNGVDMKQSSGYVFHGRAADAVADPDRRFTRMQRLLEYNRRKLEDKKPFDETSSTSVDVADHHQSIKIVGKWKEEGAEDNDSGFYSVADTPFMKKSDVYDRPREAEIEAEKKLIALEEHLLFMKSRGSPVLPIQTAASSTTKQPVVVVKPPRIPTKQNGPTPPRPTGKMTNLERKLGKKSKTVKFQGVSGSSGSRANPYYDNSTVSCTSSQNVSSTNAVFFPRCVEETVAGNDRSTFLKGRQLGGILPSSSSLFADIIDEDRNEMG